VSLEVVMGVKKFDQQTMEKLARNIRSGTQKTPARAGPTPGNKKPAQQKKEREWTDEELELFDDD
jgi:hypothetical protein